MLPVNKLQSVTIQWSNFDECGDYEIKEANLRSITRA